MATAKSIRRFEDGSVLEAASCGWEIEEPCVIIPVSVIESHDDHTIMDWIRDACDYAEQAAAIEFAGWLEQANIDTSIFDSEAKNIALLERYSPTDKRIGAAIARLNQLRARSEFRTTVKGKRRELASEYDSIFLEVGRRDGFHCQRCSVTTDLTIDHVAPLIRGGTNDLDNLQILCRSCNSRKGDK